MNVFPWIFAQINDANRVYLKLVKYLVKGKKLKLSLEKIKANEEEEEEKYNKTDFGKNTNLNIYSENLLLNISDVKIKYNLNTNKINSFINNNVESRNSNNREKNQIIISENFDLTIEKSNEFSIEKGEIVIVYGSNASGKTLFLKAILDYGIDKSSGYSYNHKHSETLIIPLTQKSNPENKNQKKQSGSSNEDFLWNSNRIYFRNNNISYVPQELWTFSASIFENITFNNNTNIKTNNDDINAFGFKKIIRENEDTDIKRFEQILQKCEMIKDIESFPEKQQKIIDFKGSNISGGQKQRINIARAAFNEECDLLLFDNCLS